MLRLPLWLRRWSDPIRSRWLHRRASRLKTIPINTPTHLEIQVRLDDPYSYLFVQMLGPFAELLDARFQPLPITICEQLPLQWPGELNQESWDQYAWRDTTGLARQHRFIPPAQVTVNSTLMHTARQTLQAAAERGELTLQLLEDIFHMLWQSQHNKLNTVCQLMQARPYDVEAQNEVKLAWSSKALTWATISYLGREYRAIDDFLRLTRRLRREKWLSGEPIFLLNHVEWGEHLVADPQTLHDIQALRPKLTFFGALEDPFTYLLLGYLQRHMVGHYNLELDFQPLPYQGREYFNWTLAWRVAQRAGVAFAPFCRPDPTAVTLLAQAIHAVPEATRIEEALTWLEAIWSQGVDIRREGQRQKLGWPVAACSEAEIEDWLMHNQQQAKAFGLPEQPIMRLQYDDVNETFGGIYRIWQIEARLIGL